MPSWLAREETDARVLVIAFDAIVHSWGEVLRTLLDEPGVLRTLMDEPGLQIVGGFLLAADLVGEGIVVYYQSPGCRQGTILALVTALQRLPGSVGTWPLDILVCSAAQWLPRTTSLRANGRTIRVHE